MNRLLRALLLLSPLLAAGSVEATPGATASTGAIPILGGLGPAAGGLPQGARAALLPLPTAYEAARAALAGEEPAPEAASVPDSAGRYVLFAPRAGLWTLASVVPDRVPWECPLAPLTAPAILPRLDPAVDRGLRVRVEDAGGRPLAGARVTARAAEAAPESLLPGPCRPAVRRAVSGDDGIAVLPRGDGEAIALTAVAAGLPPSPETLLDELPHSGDTVRLRLPAGSPRTLAVREAGGGPAAGVAVRAADGAAALGLTDDAGRLTVGVPAGGLEVELLTADGRYAAVRVAAAPPPDPEGEAVAQEIALPARVELAGRVVAADGTPLAGALVGTARGLGGARRTLAPQRPLPGSLVGVAWEPLAVAVTGTRGVFWLPAPGGAPRAESETERWAAAPGYRLAAAEVVPGGERAAAGEIELARSAAVAGTVVDPRGGGVEGAAVTLAGGGLGDPRVLSGPDGRFYLDGLEPGGERRLRATRAGFLPAERSVSLGRDELAVVGLVLELTRGIVAFGRVVDGSGSPVAGATAFLLPPDGLDLGGDVASVLRGLVDGTLPRAESDARGRFRFAALRPGGYDLLVRAEGRVPLLAPRVELAVPAADAAAAEVDLGTVALAAEAVLEGRVVDPEGRPLGGALVMPMDSGLMFHELLAQATGGPGTTAESAADGRFTVPGLAAGRELENLRVRLDGYRSRTLAGIEVPRAEPLTVVLEPLASLSGRVVDGDSEPVAGATVGILPADPYDEPVTTDRRGRFRFGELAAGRLRLVAWAPGFRRLEGEWLELTAGDELDDVELVLTAAARVDVRVRTADGSPVEGARVEVEEGGGLATGHFSPGPAAGAETDAAGRARFPSLAPGRVTIAAYHGRHERTAKTVEAAPGHNDVELRFPPPPPRYRVSGRVLTADGTPVAEAWVRMTPINGAATRAWSRRSDAAGGFSLGAAPDGEYRLSARHEDHPLPGPETRVRIDGGPVEGVELLFPAGGFVVGRVLGLEPEDLPGVEVSASSRPGHGRSAGVRFDGSYRLGPLAPGVWRIDGRTADFALRAQRVVELGPGDAEVVADLDFGAGYTLSGTLLREGRPLVGEMARTTLLCPEYGQVAFDDVDVDGRYRFSGLAAARCVLDVEVAGARVLRREIALDGDLELDLEIEPGAVAGRVVSALDGAPLDGARVELLAAADSPDVFGRRLDELRTGPSGRFRFDRVPAGDRRLRVGLDGWIGRELPLAIPSGGEPEPLEVALEPAPGLEVVVRLPSGLPAPRVRAALLDAAGTVVWSGERATGEGGRLRIAAVPAGSWDLVVAADGYAAARLPAQVPGPPLAVTLPPASRLHVSVPELVAAAVAGEPPVPASVSLLDAAGRPLPWPGGVVRDRAWLRSGQAYLDEIPPGAWRLVAEAADGRRWQGTVSLAPGADGAVELR